MQDDKGAWLQFGKQDLRGVCCNASPSIATLMTHGVIKLLAPRPAMKFCVPHAPNGAFITNRSPRCDQPCLRVSLVLTKILSIKTTHPGWPVTAGRWCLNHSSRSFLVHARCRSVAISIFKRVAEFAEEPANCIRVRLNTGCINQSSRQFGHGHVAMLINQLNQK